MTNPEDMESTAREQEQIMIATEFVPLPIL
jgi:hypothetical protein